MKLRAITAAMLAATALCATSAVYAQDTDIGVVNGVSNSIIENYDNTTNINNFSYGNAGAAAQTRNIISGKVVDGIDTKVLNVINNIVNVNVNTGLQDLGSYITQQRAVMTAAMFNK